MCELNMKRQIKLVAGAVADLSLMDGDVYTYQSSATGVLSGSLEPTLGWVQIASFTNIDSVVVQHSWKFVKFESAVSGAYLLQAQG